VPQEWALDRATLKTEDGVVILDTAVSNIHVLNFSEPFSGIVTYKELEEHLYSDPTFPEAVPYVTSYYAPRWGLCISDKQRRSLRTDINYVVDIKTRKFDGFLRYGEYFLKGETAETILLTTYLCHPSLANNELSGPLALAAIYEKLKNQKNRKFSYRFIIIPETIGFISFLAQSSPKDLSDVVAGVVLTCLGGPSNKVSFKHSRKHWIGQDSLIDSVIDKVCDKDETLYESREFSPTGGSAKYCQDT
jgi:aminopeptidase-like protein